MPRPLSGTQTAVSCFLLLFTPLTKVLWQLCCP